MPSAKVTRDNIGSQNCNGNGRGQAASCLEIRLSSHSFQSWPSGICSDQDSPRRIPIILASNLLLPALVIVKMLSVRLLLVVDGWFSLGPQERNDRSFSISHLIKTLKSSTDPRIFLDTAYRDGDLDATIWDLTSRTLFPT